MNTKTNETLSEVIRDTGVKVSGSHTQILCKCFKCGNEYTIQRRRFSRLKPCGTCVRKGANAWKNWIDRMKKLEELLVQAKDIIDHAKWHYDHDAIDFLEQYNELIGENVGND